MTGEFSIIEFIVYGAIGYGGYFIVMWSALGKTAAAPIFSAYLIPSVICLLILATGGDTIVYVDTITTPHTTHEYSNATATISNATKSPIQFIETITNLNATTAPTALIDNANYTYSFGNLTYHTTIVGDESTIRHMIHLVYPEWALFHMALAFLLIIWILFRILTNLSVVTSNRP